MENIKRKRSSEVRGDSRTSGKKSKAKKNRSNGGLMAKDVELDEFLAILKRLQTGIKHFQAKDAGDGVGKSVEPLTATSSGSLNLDLELEDFIQFQDGSRKTFAGDTIQNVTGFGFDLNTDSTSDQTVD